MPDNKSVPQNPLLELLEKIRTDPMALALEGLRKGVHTVPAVGEVQKVEWRKPGRPPGSPEPKAAWRDIEEVTGCTTLDAIASSQLIKEQEKESGAALSWERPERDTK